MRTFRSEAIFAVSSSSLFYFEAGTGEQKIGGLDMEYQQAPI